MVMEAPPSPQCVGREFVRQYYTLLNQAPSHLHRFYNNNSSFVHGGLDAPNRESNPVVGQKQIHQKIQQLNFRDCHAKISQVDSQATLGNGIVVQVTGELSNSGQPMRRFTQTFVLAAQSPKKYYVHNDIFRYQDMLGDDELEHDSVRSDGDDEVHDQLEPTHSDSCPPQSQPLPQQMGYYNNTSPLANQTNIAPAQAVTPVPPPTVQPTTNVVLQAPPQLPLINGSAHTDEVLQTQIVAPQLPTAAPATPIVPSVAPPHLISQQVVPGANAAIQTQQPASPTTQPGAPALVPVVPPPQQQPQVPLQPATTLNTTQQIPPQVPAPTVPQQPSETIPVEPEPVTPEQEEIEIADEVIVESPIKQEEDLQPEPVTANEPKTYATSVKSGASASAIHTTTSKPATTSPPPTMRPVEQRETTSSTTAANISGGFGMGQGGRGAGGPRRGAANIRGMTRTDRSGPTTRAPYVNEENGLGSSNAVDGDRRRPSSSQYPDNFQLFLGNIPSYVTEDDLKKFFTKYGTVIDVRIHGKPTNKNISGGRVPNYGFIFFDSAESAANVLKEKPIFLPGQNGDHKLNVEEKKTRSRPAMDGSRISEGGNSLAGGRNGGGNNIGNGVGPGNGNGNGGNRGGNNGQSGGGSGGNGGGNMMMRGGGSGGGMPRGGARGGFGGNRGEGRGGGNMSRGTGYRRN